MRVFLSVYLCVCLQYVVYEWDVWTGLPGPAYCRITRLYINTQLSPSHSATVRHGDAHITVDKMSQCGSWGQFKYLCPESLWNRNSLCTFLMSSRFLPGQEQKYLTMKKEKSRHGDLIHLCVYPQLWHYVFGMFFWGDLPFSFDSIW